MNYFNCFSCKKVVLLVEAKGPKCPACGSEDGEVISHQRVEEGMKFGAIFNIDLRTGKRSKSKK